MASEMDPPKR